MAADERRAQPRKWLVAGVRFATVTALQVASIAAFCTAWAAKRDTLARVALGLAALSILFALGWLNIFVGMKALTSLQ